MRRDLLASSVGDRGAAHATGDDDTDDDGETTATGEGARRERKREEEGGEGEEEEGATDGRRTDNDGLSPAAPLSFPPHRGAAAGPSSPRGL